MTDYFETEGRKGEIKHINIAYIVQLSKGIGYFLKAPVLFKRHR